MEYTNKTYKTNLLTVIVPGFLLAATGVGAGDLAVASIAGSHLGLTVLWAVVITALLLWPGTKEVFSGLLLPVIPDAKGLGISWTVALIGGVGGTLTILCYGYWIREIGRMGVIY